jgi:hypothetical protein
MGNFFEDLGGALLSPGGTKSEAVQQPTMDPKQLALFNSLMDISQQGMGKPTPSYPGQSYVPTTQQEQAYFDYASGKTKTGANQALLNVLSGKPSWESDPAKTEAFYQDSIRDPSVREFNKTTMPLITEGFSGPGFWSSNRAGATTDAVTGLGEQLNKAHSDLLYADEMGRRQALESAAGRQAQAAPRAVELESSMLGTAGQWSRQIEQEKVASELARWLSGEEINGKSIPSYNPNMQLALSLLGIQPFTYSQKQTKTGKGLLNSMFGGIGSGIGSMMDMGGE